MEHRVDDKLRPSDLEEDSVREAAKQGATHRAVDKLIRFRMTPNGHERPGDDRKELVGEAGTPPG
jgi:hypothetical protein